MEVGIDPRLPIYAGGLGILAGDTLRSFADLRIPAVGVSLLYRKGYFRQRLDPDGSQREYPVEWNPGDIVGSLPPTVQVTIENRSVVVRAWEYTVAGATGFQVPLILLDTNVAENPPEDRNLASWLYGGDERYRLSQEIVLGMGGVKMLRALGYSGIERFHMNEGHASLLAFELLREEPDQTAIARDITDVRARCVFTTHTQVEAGHDQFSYDLVKRVLGEPLPLSELQMLGGRDRLNMTLLALNLSRYVNGVAKRHGVVAQHMFPGYSIDSITNGVHSFTWTSPPFRRLYDCYIPGWSRDSFSLRYAIKIPPDEIWAAHLEAKTRLLDEIERRTKRKLTRDALTIGFARRATAWKRPDLVFRDPERLREIARRAGPLQLVFAGKAHPRDEPGKEMIRQVVRLAASLERAVPVVYLEDYDIDLARLLTSGADVWLNTPLRPMEASGTSGMKAAHNGVPSLSILDGWWIEGHVEGVTGWSIGAEQASDAPESDEESARDAADLYEKLEKVILPLYNTSRARWIDVMQRCIAVNASFFNAHRMVEQYATNAYL
ncbi:MAG: alpha-glucan family phosphorylase [Gemmatimonadetes bacterium]|nr:alpha-glucan family phosphorylase [Gemmatimonadota bacterium]